MKKYQKKKIKEKEKKGREARRIKSKNGFLYLIKDNPLKANYGLLELKKVTNTPLHYWVFLK